MKRYIQDRLTGRIYDRFLDEWLPIEDTRPVFRGKYVYFDRGTPQERCIPVDEFARGEP